MSAEIEVKVDKYLATLTFSRFDAYSATPMGCHGGILGSFGLYVRYANNKPCFAPEGVIRKKLLEGGLTRLLMDKFVAGAETAWGPKWDYGEGTSYRRKGHYVISDPWSWREGKYNAGDYGMETYDFMDIIAQYCDAEPKKYGHYVMTPATDCAAHGNNAGFPATRTMIWMPPYVELNKDQSSIRSRYKDTYIKELPKEVLELQEPPKVPNEPQPQRRTLPQDETTEDQNTEQAREDVRAENEKEREAFLSSLKKIDRGGQKDQKEWYPGKMIYVAHPEDELIPF